MKKNIKTKANAAAIKKLYKGYLVLINKLRELGYSFLVWCQY